MFSVIILSIIIGVGVYFQSENKYITIKKYQVDSESLGNGILTFGVIVLIIQLITMFSNFIK